MLVGRLLSSACCVAFALAFACCPILFAQDNGDPTQLPGKHPLNQKRDRINEEPATDKAERTIHDELDELESYLDKMDRLREYRTEPIRKVAREFEREYQNNRVSIRKRLADSTNADVTELERRQGVLSMYLWQLQQVAASVTPRSDTSSPTSRVSKLLATRKDALRDRAVLARFQALMRRSTDLTRHTLSGISGTYFFFVIPDDEDHSDESLAKTQRVPKRGNVPPKNKDVFFEHQAELNQLLKLSWHEGQLRLDREHWNVPFAGITPSEVEERVMELLKQKGIDVTPDKKAIRRSTFSKRPPIVLLFENFQHVASRSSFISSVGSRSNIFKRRSENESLECRLTFTETKFDLSVHEKLGQQRSLRISSGKPSELRISVIGKDRVTVFMQKPSGRVSLVDVNDDKTTALASDDFANLYVKNPNAVEACLFGVLGDLSMLLPPTRLEKPFVDRVVANLTKVDPLLEKQFSELMDQIDGRAFAVRMKATKALESDFDRYLPLLLKVDDQEALPLEVRARLAKVLNQYGPELRGIDSMVSKMKLMDNVDYLRRVHSLVDPEQRKHVNRQIESLSPTAPGQISTDNQ